MGAIKSTTTVPAPRLRNAASYSAPPFWPLPLLGTCCCLLAACCRQRCDCRPAAAPALNATKDPILCPPPPSPQSTSKQH